MSHAPVTARKFIWHATQRLFVSTDMWVDGPKTILDSTAGLRHYWKGRDASKVLFLDLRGTVYPDVLASNEELPFRDGVFERVVYDPPFITGEKPRTSYYYTDFGFRFWAWQHKHQLLRNVCRVNREFVRVLASDGILEVKWAETRKGLSLDLILGLLSNFREVSRRFKKSRSGSGNTLYFVDMKKTARAKKRYRRVRSHDS